MMRRRTVELAGLAAAIGLAVCLGACGRRGGAVGISLSSHLVQRYATGQVMVIPGGKNAVGSRDGVWLYFYPDGRLKLERNQVAADEYPFYSGYYEGGVLVREPTPNEIHGAIARFEADTGVRVHHAE